MGPKVRARPSSAAWPGLRPASNQEVGWAPGPARGKGCSLQPFCSKFPKPGLGGQPCNHCSPDVHEPGSAHSPRGGPPSAGRPDRQADRTDHTITTTDRLSPVPGVWDITRKEGLTCYLQGRPLSVSELRAPMSGNAGIHIQAVRILLSSIYTEDGI